MVDFTKQPNALRPRDAGRFASTNVTNEIVEAFNSFSLGQPFDESRPRTFMCQITSRLAGNSDPQTFSCTAYSPHVPPGTLASAITVEMLLGTEVFSDAIFCNYGSTIEDELESATVIFGEGVLTGYTSDDPPKAVFRGLAIQVDPCEEGA